MFVSVFKSVALVAALAAIAGALPTVAVSQTNAAQDAESSSGQQVDAEKLLAEFSQTWDESKWEKDFRGSNHIRETGEAGWEIRARTLQQLVAGGEASIPALEKALTDENAPTRILAAQAIGYLATLTNIEKLIEVAKKDDDPAARLYAVDAIGMSGRGSKIPWDSWAGLEKNRDVLMHINYAKSRGAAGVEEAVTTSLADMPADKINSAKVNEPAPDFTLKSVDGTEYSLSQFKGKQPVVLVFIYGDT